MAGYGMSYPKPKKTKASFTKPKTTKKNKKKGK